METRQSSSDEGFTLIELLVVIVILGVLATVVVFAVGGIVDRGNVNALESDERTIEIAQESHFALHARYATEAELVEAGFLNDESTLHDVTVGAGGYEIVPAGAGGSETGDGTSDGTSDEPVTTTTVAPPVPTPVVFAGFDGQAYGSGSRRLVILGVGVGTGALWSTLQATPLPDTEVIWIDTAELDTTADVDEVVAGDYDYLVAANSAPIRRTDDGAQTFVGQYLSEHLSSPGDFWWTHQEGTPTAAELEARL